ncbi:hypothetical protein D3C73_1490210 [compost metagenome]
MDNAMFGMAGKRAASHAPYCLWRPIGSDIGKDLGGPCELLTKQHGNCVQAVILSGDHIRLAYAIPIE